MSLFEPSTKRELIHRRHIECHGYRREDGLWDIEGHLQDTKTYSFPNHDRGTVKSGEAVHEMWLRLTVDDNLVIQEAEAVTGNGPFHVCKNANDRFHELKGVQIKSGWRKKVNKRIGGVNGCTHVRELLGPVATTAFQTIYPIKARENRQSKSISDTSPRLLETCHAYARHSEVVRRLWPTHHRPKKASMNNT